jgi:tetratricopeptide (TPR) repeat protein
MNLDRVGKYRVVERIGKGAMGEVYKAHDPLLNRYVALKTIASALASDPEFRRRFEREAQSAAALNHPNIITVFDFGDENGLTYMAMELLEGRDLKDLIRSREATLGDKLSIMEQMCEGLAFAHAKGVVHRDLKPSNVHVQPNGQVKILDFGLARLGASEMTRTGTVMGTPHYMSPEQVRGEKTDARSDVFSLGAVFYELLTQHRPFDAESVHAVLTQIVDRQPEPIRRWAPDVPQPIVAVVERALSKDAARRYPEAGELGRALVEARESLAGETVVGTAPERTLSTMLQAPEATVLAPAGGSHPNLRTSIKGATALTLARSRMQAALPTVRPDPTVGPGRMGQYSEGASATSKVLLAIGVLLVVAAAAGGVVWWRGRSAPQRATEVVKEEVGFLTDALVANKVELARTDLANHDYAGAIKHADEVLTLSPQNADASALREQARQAQKQLQDAVGEVRAAVARNDGQAASDALSRVMALDPAHPVIAETSNELNRHFRGQAEQSRAQAEAARAAAEQAHAGALPGFSDGRRAQQEGAAALGRQQFTLAAQRFSESRNAYERAAREAEAARAAAAALRNVQPLPTAAPTRSASVAPTTAPVTPTSLAPAAAPSATPHVAPSATLPPPVASPSASPTAAAAVTGSGDVEVRRVIADYVRALSGQDIALYRSIKPDLSSEEEKTLRRVFKEIKSWQVGINIESVQLDGERATVRASRQDVVDGRAMKAVSQVFRLARSGGSWHIQSMSQ